MCIANRKKNIATHINVCSILRREIWLTSLIFSRIHAHAQEWCKLRYVCWIHARARCSFVFLVIFHSVEVTTVIFISSILGLVLLFASGIQVYWSAFKLEKQLEKPLRLLNSTRETPNEALFNIASWYGGVTVGSLVGILLASLLLKRTIYVSQMIILPVFT